MLPASRINSIRAVSFRKQFPPIESDPPLLALGAAVVPIWIMELLPRVTSLLSVNVWFVVTTSVRVKAEAALSARIVRLLKNGPLDALLVMVMLEVRTFVMMPSLALPLGTVVIQLAAVLKSAVPDVVIQVIVAASAL